MPTPRAYFAIAVFENKIYCIGGIINIEQAPYEGNDKILLPKYVLSGVNEVYDPATDTWQTKASMPTARYGIEANLVEGKIYIVDGFDRMVAPNEVYDPATDTWTTKTPMPPEGSNHASAVIGNKIYAIANDVYTTNENDSRRLLVYDVETDRWSHGTPAPSIIIGPAVATAGIMAPARIYALGVQSLNYVYNPKSGNWTAGARMSTNRIDFGAAVVNDKLYAIGGYTFDNSLNNGKVTVSAVNEEYTPFGYGTIPPAVAIISPGNKTYASSSVSLAFTINKQALWMGYSLDGQDNVTIAGNTTLSGLPNGAHNLTVYATDLAGNTGTSQAITFSVEVPFPTALAITVSGASVAVVSIGLLIYFKKRRH